MKTFCFFVCIIIEIGFVHGNLGQLIALLVKDTNFNFFKLSSYGNWCGRGGDRMNDGSFVDGCDECCKLHDECYYRARHNYLGCRPLFTIYKYKYGEKHPGDSSEERDIRRKPSCNSEENSSPSCMEAICQCDIKFVICLQKEPCDPEIVNNKSRLWWLPG